MSIRLAEANRAIQAALAKAHNLAVNISVTVCDADGRLVAFQRTARLLKLILHQLEKR